MAHKKYIILTKDTAPLILQRILKMQSKTSSLIMNHKYTGKQEHAGYLMKALNMKKREWDSIVSITDPMPGIITQGDCKMEIDNDWNMNLIRILWNKGRYSGYEYGSGTLIHYGTKIHISSEKIVYKEMHPCKYGMTTTITSHSKHSIT